MMQTTQRQAQPVLVGTSLPRQDGPDKVTGRARYAGDQALPGLLYARLVTSPYAHARLLNIDTSAALSIPGVVAAFTAETLEMAQVNLLSRAQSPLAQDEVVWCGHPVAIVVASSIDPHLSNAWFDLVILLGFGMVVLATDVVRFCFGQIPMGRCGMRNSRDSTTSMRTGTESGTS